MLDNAGEFKSDKWVAFTKDKGIINYYTSPYTPAQNGISERLNLYLIERLIAIIKEKNIPPKLWPYLIQAIVYIKNRTYNSTIKDIPYRVLTGELPNLDYIRILGSLTYCLKPKDSPARKAGGKFGEKAYKGILVGFESSNNYLVFVPK